MPHPGSPSQAPSLVMLRKNPQRYQELEMVKGMDQFPGHSQSGALVLEENPGFWLRDRSPWNRSVGTGWQWGLIGEPQMATPVHTAHTCCAESQKFCRWRGHGRDAIICSPIKCIWLGPWIPGRCQHDSHKDQRYVDHWDRDQNGPEDPTRLGAPFSSQPWGHGSP